MLLALGVSAVFLGQPTATKMPQLHRQSSAKAVVEEHLDALNRCDWNRLMAQYPPEVEIFAPGGQVVKGRQQVGDLFRALTKPVKEGGLCGIRFEPEYTSTVDGTLNIQWRAVGPALAEPYRGADAYVTHDGLMRAQVTTFQRDQMKFK
jgi:hypothetical protein